MTKRKKKRTPMLAAGNSLPSDDVSLLGDIRGLIEAAREQTARAVNSTLVIMYWQIGRRIREDVLANDRAEYGKQIVQTLSAQLTADYGRDSRKRDSGEWSNSPRCSPMTKLSRRCRDN